MNTAIKRGRPNDYVKRTGAAGTGNSCANSVAGVKVETLGWEPGCRCGRADVIPCTVLDPFSGSGTTAIVAAENGRSGWGIDLSNEYTFACAVPRVTTALMSRPALAPLVARPVKAVRF